jgi:Permuted papain-like amidase enzyme, YaeF/YiiX, C92 family
MIFSMKYLQFLQEIDADFESALKYFREDALFMRSTETYTKHDKQLIRLYWKRLLRPFRRLKQQIRSLYWKGFLFSEWKEVFVQKYSAVITYARMLHEVQWSFGIHEEYLRTFLDENFRENYSTLARFSYSFRFLSILHFPYELFLTLHDEVDEQWLPLFHRPGPSSEILLIPSNFHRKNIFYYIQDKCIKIVAPISRMTWKILQKIHIHFLQTPTIATKQGMSFVDALEPGDIILTRTNWIATNITIPGFWKHMSLYVGKGHQIRDWIPKNFHDFHRDDSESYFLEAVWSGIRLRSTSEFFTQLHYIAAIRPKLSQEKRISACSTALALLWRPYDYTFNYYLDAAQVCSTLVTKAYLPSHPQDEGLAITLVRIWPNLTYPPNDAVHLCTGDAAQADFVVGIDQNLNKRTSQQFTKESFLTTMCRSRFSLFLYDLF